MMLLAFLLAAQAAQPSPDIELEIRATVREVRIEQAGEASLEMRAGPDGGTIVDVDKPETARPPAPAQCRRPGESRGPHRRSRGNSRSS